MKEVERKNNKLYGLSDKEISRRANDYESCKIGSKTKGTNHGVRTGARVYLKAMESNQLSAAIGSLNLMHRITTEAAEKN